MELSNFIVTTFVIVDDFCKNNFPVRILRTRGPFPKLSDSEVITMELIGEYLSIETDEGIYNYFKNHWHEWFPYLPDRSNFVRQCANLWYVKQRLFEYLNQSEDKYLQMIDSMPIEVCKFVRAKYTRQFKNTAKYGKWFGETFFGYRLHLKITEIGMIRNFILAPANEHDIHFAEPLLADDVNGWVLGDKGYRSKNLQGKLWNERKIYFHTSLRRIDKKTSPLPKDTIKKLSGKRRLVETVAGQLEQRFSMKTTFARDLWHLMNRIIRKIVSHTYCVFLNLNLNYDPLKLRTIII